MDPAVVVGVIWAALVITCGWLVGWKITGIAYAIGVVVAFGVFYCVWRFYLKPWPENH